MSRASAPQKVYSLSEGETFDLGRTFCLTLRGGEIVTLEGELGLGKTVFARGIAFGLGIPEDEVSSPSYTLVQEYRGGRLPMFHADLYRIDAAEETESLGLSEYASVGGIVVVEWGEKLPRRLLQAATRIRFTDMGEDARMIVFTTSGTNQLRR